MKGRVVLTLVLALEPAGWVARAEPARPETGAPGARPSPAEAISGALWQPGSDAPLLPPKSVAAPGPAPQKTQTPASAKSIPPPTPIKVSADPRPSYAPDTFIATMRAADRYLALAEAGGWPSLPAGLALKKGDRSDPVLLLRKRLVIAGDLGEDQSASDLFDDGLAAALTRFQVRHGLPETGRLGPQTLAALNVPAETRHRQLASSAQRLIGSGFAFGERYVAVNIPSATVEAVEAGRVVRRYVAVVGKPDRPSPSVATKITAINLNPTWTVPVSLIRKDIIPHMRRDPTYLAGLKIRVLDAQGAEVDPARIDWSTEKAVNFTLRQDPGAANSLGQIRIDMPNRQAVYMHDTPSKRLFAQSARFHSSGCVRVAGVNDLAAWLLEGTPAASGEAWTASGIAQAISGGRRQDIKLGKPVAVAWTYMTGYATSDGAVHFRDDVYGLDSPTAPSSPLPASADVSATASIVPRSR